MNFTFFPSSTLPAPYAIVWCRFPHDASLGEPGPKPRPAIVLNVALDEESGEAEVQLIYGTTNLKMMKRRNDFFITNFAEMEACGLDKATRFDLDQIVWVPWAKEWFETLSGYDSPVIGRLSAHGVRLLQYEFSWRQAKLAEVDSED